MKKNYTHFKYSIENKYGSGYSYEGGDGYRYDYGNGYGNGDG